MWGAHTEKETATDTVVGWSGLEALTPVSGDASSENRLMSLPG